MQLVVTKFGGSSLANGEGRRRALDIIRDHRQHQKNVLVVVSAMGRKGEPYATDTLISLLEETNASFSRREQDLLLSCGEIISAVIMAEALRSNGIEARSYTGGQAGLITDNNQGQTQIKRVYPVRLICDLEAGIVPVVAGFQGITWEGEVTTLGRGGSDTTATALGIALEAEEVEIYTDVRGIMTADPKKVPRARLLKEISFNDACEMSYQGARVIHSRAVELAKNYNIPIRVKNTFTGESGSVICDGSSSRASDQPVTGLASRSEVIFVQLRAEKGCQRQDNIFTQLAEAGISLDFINLRQEGISFLIDRDKLEQAERVLREQEYSYQIDSSLVKVSIIGGGMTGLPGVMARIVNALSDEGIEIYQITDSHTTISCLVHKEEEHRALNVLHNAFNL